jgi:GT2 family glycosyltransferase
VQLPFARIVVVDNHSSHEEQGAVTALAAERGWELLALPDNNGFAAGVNAGAARARDLGTSGLLLLNPDARVSPEVIAELAARVHADPMTMVCPRIVDSGGTVVFDGSAMDVRSGRLGRLGTARAVPWLTAACLAVPSALFERLGGMDESYFLYWEDVDLSFRAHTLGAHLVVASDLTAVHDEGGTQHRSGRAKSSGYYRYNARNRLLFAAHNLSRGDLARWVLRTPVESTQILLRGGRRQLIKSPRPLLAIVRGSLSGLAIAVRALASRRPVGTP